ncbi:MAG: hypothetical protein ABJB85_12275 [Nitrososphaerota archaeon]
MNFKFGICGIICTFGLTFFAVHAYGQNPEVLDGPNAPTGSGFNSSTDIVSSVPNVTVTKFEILSPKSIGLDLKYSGTGNSPAVKVDSSVIILNPGLEEFANQIGTLNESSINSSIINASNSTTSLITKLDQLGDILFSSNGTESLKAGWKSPNSFTINLKGNATLNNAQFVAVLVRDSS